MKRELPKNTIHSANTLLTKCLSAASFVSDDETQGDTDWLEGWRDDPPSNKLKNRRRKSERQQHNGPKPLYDLKEMFSQAFDG